MAGHERPLTVQEQLIFKPYFAKIVIEQARIVEGKVPFWLRGDMCAVVLSHRIYFRIGAYQANTARGVELLGHELTHVSQFLHGMNWIKYVWSCRNGYKKSPYELEAYAKGQFIAENFNQWADFDT
ncbi:MAG: eCIS core domain-containing protein [Methylophilaceae bacterium]